jgi:hypothetical protein
MKTVEKSAWAVGGLGFVAAAIVGFDERPADGGGLVIAIASYAVGLLDHRLFLRRHDVRCVAATAAHGAVRIVVPSSASCRRSRLQYALDRWPHA